MGVSLTGNSRITFSNNATFESNWAEMGGGMYIRHSNVIMKQHANITTRHNHARYYGGAPFHEDNINNVTSYGLVRKSHLLKLS